MRWRRAPEIGLAISSTGLFACAMAPGPRRVPLAFERTWDATDGGRRATLTSALRSLQAAAPGSVSLRVVLLPPLAELRLVTLPPLPTGELRPAVARDIRRYLPVESEPQIVQIQSRSEEADAPRAHLLSVAAEALVEDVLAAADTTGWEVRSIVPASLAWANAAVPVGAGDEPAWITIRTDEREDALCIGAHGIQSLRRRFLPSTGEEAASTTIPLAPDLSSAMRLAAAHAALPDASSLWPDRIYSSRLARVWRQAAVLAGTCVGLLLLAAAIEWLALRRDESQVAAARATIRLEVADALARRDSLVSLQRALGRIRGFESATPSWLALLSALESALPGDASLISLRGTTDTLVLVGEAERTEPVLGALTGVSALQSARTDAPIQQIIEDGEVVAERFTILVLPRRGVRP